MTAYRLGALTAELWIPGQSTPVCNSNVEKFSMMLIYSNQERQKTSLTHLSTQPLSVLLWEAQLHSEKQNLQQMQGKIK